MIAWERLATAGERFTGSESLPGAAAVLGIVVAMEREARIVRAALDATGLAHAARVAVCGIGPQRARVSALALVDAGASALAVIGFAGALIDGIAAGDLLLPARVRDGEDTVRDGGDAHAATLLAALSRIATVHTGVLASVAQPVANSAAKRALALASGAVAVDMESACVVRVALAAGLPWTVLRAVSDAVERSLPRCALQGVDALGRVRPAALAAALLRRPWELGALPRLARDVRAAQQVLSAATALALPVLCAAPFAARRA